MSVTKNVQYVELDETVFQRLVEKELDSRVEQLQETYMKLREKVDRLGEKTNWLKIKDEDLLLYVKDEKILMRDPRALECTRLNLVNTFSYKRYSNELLSIGSLDASQLQQKKRQAKQENRVIPTKFEETIFGLKADNMSYDMAKKLFCETENTPFLDEYHYVVCLHEKCEYIILDIDSEYSLLNIRIDSTYQISNSNSALKISTHTFEQSESLFYIAIRYGLYFDCLKEEELAALKDFHSLYIDEVPIGNIGEIKAYLKNKNIDTLAGISFQKETIERELGETTIQLDKEVGEVICTYLNEFDYHRGRIQKYSERWYRSDEGVGHWDVWSYSGKQRKDTKETSDSDYTDITVSVRKEERGQPRRVIHLSTGIVARNPLEDVQHDAVVGIDFGTKSTIVVVQNGDEEIVPMRVGMADYLAEPQAEHYENPTVMQFCDLENFLSDYHSKSGRPYTSWDDVRISHEAFMNMISARESKELSSFLSDLKQWASGRYTGKRNGRVVLRDDYGFRVELQNYLELSKEDIDPIELYAYYLGMFINNMYTGIYLDYLLSFPETFSLELKQRLLESFERGIRHSLPAVVFEDDVCQAAFRVRQGSSEPAAYAACALEQYGIEATEEGIFYGIFDFGGGTTDFDYGIWKAAPEEELNYNYILKHFGSGGDKTLGGENILQLLAYDVFCDEWTTPEEGGKTNLQMMRENRLVFFKPEEGIAFAGSEALVKADETAILNTKQMMEVLRPIWEEYREWQEWAGAEEEVKKETSISYGDYCLGLYADGTVTAEVSLFEESGKSKQQIKLALDVEMIEEEIEERIEIGVRNFFESLKLVYEAMEQKSEAPIHLFLAGNSSKSSRVIQMFERYCQAYQDILFPGSEGERFLLFPPLGTQEAERIQGERGVEPSYDPLMSPTGKTGVAFGLVMCREGSIIHVEAEQKKDTQIKLNYYIGINYRKNFKMIFDRDVAYGEWKKFIKILPEAETFEFYYTDLPEVVKGTIKIKDNTSIHKKKCLIDKNAEGAFLFFRFIHPSQLEYVVAMEDKIGQNEYVSSIYKVDL